MTGPEALPSIDLADQAVSVVVESVPDAMLIIDSVGTILMVNRQLERMFGYDRAELSGRPVEGLLPERLREVHRAHRNGFLAHPKTRPMGEGRELLARRRDGSEFPAEVSLSPVSVEGQTAVIASVRDITDRVEAAARVAEAQAEVEAAHRATGIERDRQERWLRGLSEIQGVLLSGRPIAEALTLVCRFACDLSGATMASVGQPDDEGEAIQLISVLSEAEVPTGTTFRIDGPIRTAMETLRAVVRHDLPADAPEAVVGLVGPSLVAPLITGGEVIGVLLLSRPIGSESFEPDVIAYVESFAQQAAGALDQARVLRDRQRLAVLEDRERIGRDLHDLVIQRLFATGMGLEAVAALVPAGPVRERVEDTVSQLDETIDEIRTTIFDLSAVPKESIATRILDTVVAHTDHLGFDPVVGLSQQLEAISPRLVQHLLPVLNEALSNVARHADATTVTVTIDVVDGTLVLTVRDDGVGIGSTTVRGNGLDNLESRAERLGGRCRVEPGPEGGTVLTWQTPL